MLYSNCMDCPHHLVVNDPDPTDSFNDDDVAVLCTKTPNHSQRHYYAYKRLFEYEPITVSCRPHYKRKESITPKWCPLLRDAAIEDLIAHWSHCSSELFGKCPICNEYEQRKRGEQLESHPSGHEESTECICKGNWRKIIAEVESKIGTKYINEKNETLIFVGVLWAEDDFYYTFWRGNTSPLLSTCVIDFEFTLKYNNLKEIKNENY